MRHGFNIHLFCSNTQCRHEGIVDAFDANQWFRLHNFPRALEAGMLRHFRCSKCSWRASSARPTEAPVTVNDFFPPNVAAWRRVHKRLRG